jgi:hypothetical protein
MDYPEPGPAEGGAEAGKRGKRKKEGDCLYQRAGGKM